MTMCRKNNGWKSALAVAALLAGGPAVQAAAQAPSVTTRTTLATNLSGVAGKIAANKFGDVFQGSTFGNAVYEFPANGGAPVQIFTMNRSYTGNNTAIGSVTVDGNQNLYITVLFLTATSSSDSNIYEFPYVNGSYPANYTLNGPVAACGASPTAVCAWGNFLSGIDGYYYGPWDFAIDGNGTGYLVTDYDGSASSSNSGNNIFACNAACEARAANAGPTILAGNLPNPVLSLIADPAGDVFYADGSSHAYVIYTGTTTPVAVSGSFNQTIGVGLDSAGNLYVTDCSALYELKVQNGSYTATAPFEIVPLPGGSTRTSGGGYNGGGVAFDREGNVFAATGFANLYKYNLNNGAFAAASAPSGTSTLAFNVVLNRLVTAVTLTPTGPQASDFSVSGSTCTAGGGAGSTCTFNGTFQPGGVGLRRAAIRLTDSAGDNLLLPVAGTGQGAGVAVDPGTVSKIGSGFKSAAGAAVDGAGNLFVADSAANAVYEYAAGTTTQTSVGTGFTAPTGVALDGAGNLYVADAGGNSAGRGRVVQVPLVAGVYNSAAQSVIVTGLGTLKGLFIDGYGTVYAADSTNKNIFSIPRAQFGQAGGVTFGNGLTAPADVSVDAAGDLYIADPQANQVVMVGLEGAQSPVGTGLSGPTGVDVEASGSIVIADQGNQRVVRVPNESGTLNPNDQTVLATTISAPYAVRIDAGGNLIVTDNTANLLDRVDRSQGAVQFSNVNVNTTSSAQAAYIASEGNTGLGLGSPLYTPPAAPFSLTQGTPACTPGSTLNAGFSCQLSAKFSPTVKGPQSSKTTFNISAVNTTNPALTLSGSGLQLATPTVTLQQTSPGPLVYGQSVTFTATVSGSAGTPAGNIYLVVDGTQQPSKPLVNGSASFTLTGLSGGPHTLYAQYPGDGVNYAAGTSTPALTITVAQATATITVAVAATAVSPLSAAVGDPITFSSTLTPSVAGYFSGTVSYVSNGVTLASTTNLVAGSNGTYTASVTTTSVQAGSYQVVAVYSGNANYSGATSTSSVPLVVVATSGEIVLTPASTSIKTSANNPGSTGITVSSLAGFQGGVVFRCTNLPAYATCTFNPAILTLIASSTATPLSVPPQRTTLTVSVNQPPTATPTSMTLWGALLLALLLVRFRGRRGTWRVALGSMAAVCLLALAAGGAMGCASGTVGTPAGTYPVVVTAVGTPSVPASAPTSSANNATASFTLNVTVQ